MLDRRSLVVQLKALGLQSGMVVMVHASMRAIGALCGGPDQLHQAIMEVLTPAGTLMMYVGCPPEYECLGRGKLSTEEEAMVENACPAFDPTTTRARRDHGILAEFFRSWPGVQCSIHPGARVAALGRDAIWMTANHPLLYGYGRGSPFEKLHHKNGKILLLGSDLDQITILHYVESIVPIYPKNIVRYKVPYLQAGQRVWWDLEEYDTSMGIRPWPAGFFAKILEDYLLIGQFSSGKVGQADSLLIDVPALVEFSFQQFLKAAPSFPC